ncbi:hypothetical protein ACS0TY_004739 [Phlomoides rotata]
MASNTMEVQQTETSRLLASEERPWTLECFEHSPQQINCHDCGIICVKIFECLISGRHIGCIDVKKCPKFRFSMCHDIFRHSDDYPCVHYLLCSLYSVAVLHLEEHPLEHPTNLKTGMANIHPNACVVTEEIVHRYTLDWHPDSEDHLVDTIEYWLSERDIYRYRNV